MSNGVIDPMSSPKYVLEGKVVTMGPQGVVPRGAIYIDAGEIIAVQSTRKTPPPGFEDADRIRTGDTLYPGLIELHNHLCYNAMPLWDVPKKYANNGQWKNHEDYRRLITKPSQVLGRTAGVVEALVRYVECRCLLGGVTTSQGITLSSAPGIKTYYEGIVRNVEHTNDPVLPEAGTKIANPSTGGAQKYLDRLKSQTCYLQHLSEGTNDTARGWFLRLQLESGDWAINDALCGIHSTALRAEDFRVMAGRGASMVWSPLSNYLLYGDTVDIQAARDAGILMGIGSDWAPSGSKNLLGELKVAWLASQESGGVFTAEELVAMATIDAARILKWDALLGSIEPGKRADIIAVNGQKGDDYLRMIEARETSITLVIINGVPRLGQKRLMNKFAPGTEEIRVGRSQRILNLAQETTHPLVRSLTLTEATERLRNAMQNLPVLAQDLDNAGLNGLLGGSADASGTPWRMVMDIEEDEIDETTLAAQPLAEYVQPMEMEGITVADDSSFLRNLVAARNLPEFVKKGLPPLYGKTIPLPESAEFLEQTPDPLPPQLVSTTQELKTFLRTWGELTLAARKTIVDQAMLVIEQNYVHLPLKRAMHAVDPVQHLKLLRHRLEETEESDLGPEMEFHNELTEIFNSLRDLHTTYRLPTPFREKTAWLPFIVEEYWEHDHRKYLVSNLVGDAGPETFQPGVEILHWNGMPIQHAVAQNADRRAGSNRAARHARGLDALTIRPLAYGLPPEDEWVTLHYVGLDGKVYEWTQNWLVFEPGYGIGSLDPEKLAAEATFVGLDEKTDSIREAKRVIYTGDIWLKETHAADSGELRAIKNTSGGIPTYLPSVFRAKPVDTTHGTFGYIRIFSFNISEPDAFVDEFVRLVDQLPEDGLIIDVRGNPGGHIHAAERLLQVLTHRRIEPQRAQFINAPINLQLCRQNAPSRLFSGLDLKPWIRSIKQSVETGAVYSLGYPITPELACNDIGQKYYGPVLLIVDALCYSASDILASGFKDHSVGPILGTSTNTGAGGANVWSHRLLQALINKPTDEGNTARSPYTPLPLGSDIRVAIRRTLRVGPNAGVPVEDLGIIPDEVHQMTRRDLMEGNPDLIEKAGEILAAGKSYSIKAQITFREGAWPQIDVETHNITRLDVFINGRPHDLVDVTGHTTTIKLSAGVSGEIEPLELMLRGFEEDELVAVFRKQLP